jgi:hypothetical protein
MSEYRNRILGHGSRFSHPCFQGAEECTSILENLWRIPTDARSYTGACDRNATSDTIGVRAQVWILMTIK